MTEHTSGPTVEQLLKEQKNLTEQLTYSNSKVIELTKKLELWEEAELGLLVYLHWYQVKERIFSKIKGWFQ